MGTRAVILEHEQEVAILRLNRPERRNAMNDEMAAEFAEANTAAACSEETRALVVTGNGAAFCAGGDLEGFAKWDGADPADVERGLCAFYGSFLRIMDLEIPTIAAVNGPAVGAGACLAAACDIRVASSESSIGFTFVKLGINPGMGAEFLLHRLVGPARAVELLMTGDVLTATDAHRIGLFNRLVFPPSLLESAVELARTLASRPPAVLRVVKQNAAAAAAEPIDRILRREAQHQAPTFTDPAFQKKIRQMLEKPGNGTDR